MSRPHALLRVGFNYDRTLGMRRLTNTATDVAIDGDGSLHILCRGENLVFIRHLSMNDDDLGGFNLVGGGGAVGGSFKVEGEFRWPAAMVLGRDGNLWLSDEGTHRVSVLTTKGELVSQWGEFGKEPGQLNRPSGLAHGPDGNVYIADTLNHRIQRFTADGIFVSTFGEYGQHDGQFDMPWGIDVDELGDIVVSDWRNDRVQKFKSEGEFVFSIGSTGSADAEFNRPSGVTVDKDGDIYVADWANHRVQLFDQTGRFVEKFIGDASLGRQAREYMITNLVAMRLREMTSLEPQKRLRWPTSVRTDGEGRLYIADYGSHRVQVYKKEALPLSADEIAVVPRSHSLYTQF